MVETVVEFFRDRLPAEIVVFVVSLLPILELRGGLIASAILGIKWSVAFPLCVIGNVLPIPFILLLIRKIFNYLKRFKKIVAIIEKLDNKAKEKGVEISKSKFALWGLFCFVAIPLPGTGAWTGALVADVLDIRVSKAFPIITLGVIVAGLIISFISYVIPMMF